MIVCLLGNHSTYYLVLFGIIRYNKGLSAEKYPCFASRVIGNWFRYYFGLGIAANRLNNR